MWWIHLKASWTKRNEIEWDNWVFNSSETTDYYEIYHWIDEFRTNESYSNKFVWKLIKLTFNFSFKKGNQTVLNWENKNIQMK